MAEQQWVRVSVTIPADVADRAARAELAADGLWGFGPAAIEERDVDGSTVLLAGFDSLEVAQRATDHLRRTDQRGTLQVRLLHGDDPGLDAWREDAWRDEWRAWAEPVAAGPFWIVPAWLTDTAPPDDGTPGSIRLLVDPAHTFGSGSHPTTRLVLAALADLVGPGDTVLDVGCGSGILAVGAALLGARDVSGIDIDPGAPAATEANARANDVAARVHASCTPLDQVAQAGERFTIVAANLLAPVVRDLASHLAAVVHPGGALVVSGLLEDRWAEATSAITDGGPGWAVERVDAEDGWVAATLRYQPERPVP